MMLSGSIGLVVTGAVMLLRLMNCSVAERDESAVKLLYY